MSDILKSLGVDADDLNWRHLAACSNMVMIIHKNNNTGKRTSDLDPFFDNYESDPIVAEQTDQMCLFCPVNKQCLQDGISNKDPGVWGGIYLDNGKTHKKFNAHKTAETWKRLKKIHGKLP